MIALSEVLFRWITRRIWYISRIRQYSFFRDFKKSKYIFMIFIFIALMQQIQRCKRICLILRLGRVKNYNILQEISGGCLSQKAPINTTDITLYLESKMLGGIRSRNRKRALLVEGLKQIWEVPTTQLIFISRTTIVSKLHQIKSQDTITIPSKANWKPQ